MASACAPVRCWSARVARCDERLGQQLDRASRAPAGAAAGPSAARLAVGGSGDCLISSMISSMSPTARIRPSRMWARWRALRSRKLRPPADDLLAVVDEHARSAALQLQRPRLAVDQGDVDHREVDLQRRVLVELVDARRRRRRRASARPRSGSRACGRTRRGRRRCRGCVPSLTHSAMRSLIVRAEHLVGDLVDDDRASCRFLLLDVHAGRGR